jgi:hypothetical protein
MSTPFSTTGAIAAQSNAHTRLMAAIANGTAVRILYNGAPYMTAPSLAAAKMLVGTSKAMTIVAY